MEESKIDNSKGIIAPFKGVFNSCDNESNNFDLKLLFYSN